MPTILEIINLSAEYLAKKDVESPRLNAELLLASVLKTNRVGLYLMFERPLQENEVNSYREFIRRRGGREPLQYILGEDEFMGLKMKVNKSVLIPRPETEILVEESIKILAGIPEPHILDIGCGSGNIAIAIAKNLPGAKIISIDKDASAIEVAKENAEMNGVSGSVSFFQIDANEMESKFAKQFDLIVSNPPYVSIRDFEELQLEVREYEPVYAVTDDSDGLTFYKIIAGKSQNLLKPGGKVAVEMAMGQSKDIASIFEKNDLGNISVIKDLAGIERIVTGELR